MKQIYEKPSLEWVDFNHAERIAASGGGCEAVPNTPHNSLPGGCVPAGSTWNNAKA